MFHILSIIRYNAKVSVKFKLALFCTIFVLGALITGCGVVSNQTIGNIVHVIPKGFLRVINDQIKDDEGQTIFLKGFCLTNGVYSEESLPFSDEKFILSDSDYNTIQSDKANVVRFYLQYSWLNDDVTNNFFAYMDEQLQLIESHNLKAILSLHYFGTGSTGGFYNGSQANVAQLIAFWEKISNRYKNNSVIAGYDLLNEPDCSNGFTETTLYDYYEEAIATIRNNNDNHIVFISDPVNKYATPNASYFDLAGESPFKKLSDSNVVYQFHWYQPIKFTHQTVSDNYFQLGADYPYLNVEDEIYKGGWYENQKKIISNTVGWVTLTSDTVHLDNFIVSNNKLSPTNKVGLSISLSNINGYLQIKNVKVQKSIDSSFSSFIEVPIKNHDFTMKRRFVDDRPANWYVLKGNSNDNTADETTNYCIENDYLNIDFTGDTWVPQDWATLKINWWDGHRNYIDYTYGDGYYYRVIFDINSNITQGEIFAAFEFYELINQTMQNKNYLAEQITNYYINWAKNNKVPLYCSEWGVADPSQTISNFPNAPDQQISWINDMAGILNSNGIHWTYHDYKNYDNLGFGIYDAHSNPAIQTALKKWF